YKKGRVYIFRIRSAKKLFLQKLQRFLPITSQTAFQVLACQQKKIPDRFIQQLYTMTPVIATVDGQPFLPGDDIDLLIKRIQGNLEKKYKDLYGEETFEQSFIKRIEIINRKPIALHYKSIKLLGCKLKLDINEDNKSQRLARTALSSGLLEKNSIGGGFCVANYI
ncbi:CRISPR-associated endoribonuclease Cas6, partial [Bacillaceae bacterium Marseille-Q3522]|nr:CRISPR-associated endoribonuclease Cas6 [Bacillaceae bacterium Marseille-Q3522]